MNIIKKKKYSRRDFAKLCGLGLFGLAFRPYFSEGEYLDSGDHLVRVAVRQVSIYDEPTDKSKILFQRYRDDLMHVYYETISPDGPTWNPIWYRVWGGWVHRAYMETVRMKLNTPVSSLWENGQVFEVTVPYSQSFWYSSRLGWQPNWRVYYGSNHWVVDIKEGPDGEPWYEITNDIVDNVPIYVPAIHMRPFEREELTPINPDVPEGKKRIEISIVDQELTAYEDGNPVLHTKVSTGLLHPPRPGLIPLATPKGTFSIISKMPCKHMGNGILTTDMEEYVLPGVPWTMFFEPGIGAAIHGCYWHTNYGIPMSHACVNMRNEDAQWLYRWSDPKPDPGTWLNRGYGTEVEVF